MRRITGLSLITALLAPAAQAEPCIGTGFDIPLPGATRVEWRVTDVPSARVYGTWQEGRIAGLVYQLSSDYSGMLAPSWESPDWQITITCDPISNDCTQENRGEVATDAPQVAALLARCLQGEAVSPEEFDALSHAPRNGLPADAGVTDVQRPIHPHVGIAMVAGSVGARGDEDPDPSATAGGADAGDPGLIAHGAPQLGSVDPSAPEAAVDAEQLDRLGPSIHPPQNCGLDAIEPGTPPVLTLQTLLQAAGFDPGPADGLMGQKTRNALSDALGPEASDLSMDEAITALNAKLCQG